MSDKEAISTTRDASSPQCSMQQLLSGTHFEERQHEANFFFSKLQQGSLDLKSDALPTRLPRLSTLGFALFTSLHNCPSIVTHMANIFRSMFVNMKHT